MLEQLPSGFRMGKRHMSRLMYTNIRSKGRYKSLFLLQAGGLSVVLHSYHSLADSNHRNWYFTKESREGQVWS